MSVYKRWVWVHHAYLLVMDDAGCKRYSRTGACGYKGCVFRWTQSAMVTDEAGTGNLLVTGTLAVLGLRCRYGRGPGETHGPHAAGLLAVLDDGLGCVLG